MKRSINELLKKRSKSSNIECLKDLGTETTHKRDISNAMNNFFCSVGKDLAKKLSLFQILFCLVTMKLTKIKLSSALRQLRLKISGLHCQD